MTPFIETPLGSHVDDYPDNGYTDILENNDPG